MNAIDRRDHRHFRILFIDVAELWNRLVKPALFGWW